MEPEAAHSHAKTADFDANIRAGRKRSDRCRPGCEHVLALGGIEADADRPADVVEDDPGVREGAGQIGELVDLRVIEPSVEREAEAAKDSEAVAEGLVGKQARRWAVGGIADGLISIPCGDVTDAAEAVSAGTAASTGSTRLPSVKSAWPTMPAHTLVLP